MLKPAVRRRGDRPLKRSNRNVPTKIHAVLANEYRLRDPSVRDDSDDARPTRAGLFDLRDWQVERAKTERRDQSYKIDERSSDDNRQRRRRFAGNKIPDRRPARPNLLRSIKPTGSRHAEKQIARWPGNRAVPYLFLETR